MAGKQKNEEALRNMDQQLKDAYREWPVVLVFFKRELERLVAAKPAAPRPPLGEEEAAILGVLVEEGAG